MIKLMISMFVCVVNAGKLKIHKHTNKVIWEAKMIGFNDENTVLDDVAAAIGFP